MNRIGIAILTGALLIAPMSLADDAHHADEATATPPAAAAAATEIAEPQPKPGGMMQGMMSPDMMRMMMGMMSAGNNSMARMSPMGSMMMSPEHIDGRIAFLAAELNVTEAQQPLWETLAEAIRSNAGSIKDTMPGMQDGTMMQDAAAGSTALEQIDLYEKALAARLQALQQIKTALEPFYAALDETQKQKADKLLLPAPMGMM